MSFANARNVIKSSRLVPQILSAICGLKRVIKTLQQFKFDQDVYFNAIFSPLYDGGS